MLIFRLIFVFELTLHHIICSVQVPKNQLKGNSAAAAAARRRRAGTVEHCDYLTNKNYKPTKRRRTDPVVSLASILEGIHAEVRVKDEALQFLQPVNTKKVSHRICKFCFAINN